jgi:hypothetical protein
MKDNNYIKNILLTLFIVVTAGLSLLYIELHNNNSIQKSKFSQELKAYFENNRIDSAMEDDIYLNKPLLIVNKGRWDDKDLNYYIGFFETLSDYMDAGSLNYRDVFDEYSDDVLLAYHNKEIQKYINSLRKDSKDNTYYEKFERLSLNFEKSNNKIK